MIAIPHFRVRPAYVAKATQPMSPDELRLARLILEAAEATKDSIVLSRVREYIAAGNIRAALETVAIAADAILAKLPRVYRDVMESAGDKAAAKIGLAFDVVNPATVDFARDRAAALIREFGESSQDGVRAIIERAALGKIDPAKTARMIRDSGIGLTRTQALAVMRLRERLEQGGANADRIESQAARYARKLLNYRAEVIARTEIIAAESAGTQEAWGQAVDKGLLSRTAQQEWLTTPDEKLCPICSALDGKRAPLGGQFQSEIGPVSGPPAHPQCRCALRLVV